MRLLCLVLSLLLAATAHARPLIGINTDVRVGDTGYVSLATGAQYVDAVLAAGGLPVLLPATPTPEEAAHYAALVDGFLLIGGADITPARYGQEPHETTRILNQRRESFDFALLDAALATRKPLLGVCLGMQELFVARGGAMIQDIPSQTDSTLIHRGEGSGHDVLVVPGTRLHAILGAERVSVNSLHHQACVGEVPGVIVSARSPDGIIEAIELEDHPFALAVQWHPEALAEQPEQVRLFEALVREAAAR